MYVPPARSGFRGHKELSTRGDDRSEVKCHRMISARLAAKVRSGASDLQCIRWEDRKEGSAK